MATTEGESLMKRWTCTECNGSSLKVSIDEIRLYLKCEDCNDTEWVRLTNQTKRVKRG
jgi:hypothetical protein